MKKSHLFALGILAGGLTGFLLGFFLSAAKNGIGSNSGSEFYGSEYTNLLLSNSGKGLGNNSGSKFYSDTYIKEKFKQERENPCSNT